MNMNFKLTITHFVILFALTPALVFLSGCGKDSADAAAKGEAALRDGDYAVAAKALDVTARKTQPTTHLYYNLGAAKALAGDLDGAIRAFDNAEHEDISNFDAVLFKAYALAKKGNLAAAHELLDRTLGETTDTATQARILNALAVVEHGLHFDDLACVRLAKAIRLAPDYAPSYYNFAHFLEEVYQLHDAALANIAKFEEKASGDNPVREKAAAFKASVEAAAKRTPPRKPHTTTAAATKFVKQGSDAYSKSKWTLAEESFAKALETDPESYEAAVHLANTRWAARHFESAADAYAKAAALDPKQFYPVYMQGYIAYSLNNSARARQIFTGVAVPRWPDNAKSYEIAAYALASESRSYEARVYGGSYIELAKAAGDNVSSFEAWLKTLPQLALLTDK